MNANDKKKVVKGIEIVNSNESRSMPITKGTIIHFDATAENFIEEVAEQRDANGVITINAWTRINGTDGSISATQLLRRGNGLNLSGDTNTERLQDLVANYSDADCLFSVLVTDIKERNDRNYCVLDIRAGITDDFE